MTIWKKSHNKTIHTEDDIVIIVDERKLLAEKKKTMDVLSSTIRELLVKAEAAYGTQDAFRYKIKQENAEGKKAVAIESKTYTSLKKDSESFSCALQSLGEQKKHIAILGSTSYEWVIAYLGTVNSGSVAVPLDTQLTTADLCELINRAEVTTLVIAHPSRLLPEHGYFKSALRVYQLKIREVEFEKNTTKKIKRF